MVTLIIATALPANALLNTKLELALLPTRVNVETPTLPTLRVTLAITPLELVWLAELLVLVLQEILATAMVTVNQRFAPMAFVLPLLVPAATQTSAPLVSSVAQEAVSLRMLLEQLAPLPKEKMDVVSDIPAVLEELA